MEPPTTRDKNISKMDIIISSKTDEVDGYDLSISTATAPATATAIATWINNHHQLNVSNTDTAIETASTRADSQQPHPSINNHCNPNPTHESMKALAV